MLAVVLPTRTSKMRLTPVLTMPSYVFLLITWP
ncbi:Uncharacterised protein [Vibrio cholerae]|nr:Uncharacterised protein [Vibrio cholerae]CSI41857.1 Uncharacterised protein [Vibrio cholerae]CSI92640.1 Uncharacterised protein [Vibrio cholerae]